ncbi:hypothetical protein AB3R30_23525 [Leptolyngbyaceae cyanobacterium UHCC 1019]
MLFDCPTPAIVMNAAAYSISGVNQKLYSRLKTSLQLNLRRQIFLAVCDDLELRSYLVAQLQTALRSPRFVSLNLNLSDPNPMAQVAQWLSQHGNSPDTSHSPGFQILGIEHLTRQPAPVQKRFLTHLQAIEYYLPGIDGTIVLWLPRPWLRSLQQSAPAFWDWHTALFEFEGDPAPLRNISQARLSSDRTLDSAIAPLPMLPADHYTDHSSLSQPPPAPVLPLYCPEPFTESLLEAAPIEESIWDMLTYDLAQLDAGDPPRNEATPKIPLTLREQNSKLKTSFTSTSRLTQQILAALTQEPALAEHQTALRTLQQIDQLLEQRAAPKTIAAAYRELGRLYQNQLEQGNPSPETLEVAIAVHEKALEWLQDDTLQWVDGANDLGNLYWMQSHNAGADAGATKLQQQLSSLQKAIHIYTLALDKTTPQANPHTYTMIQNNLGSAYGDLAHYQDPANNLLKSVEAYESALHSTLRYCDPQENTARNAATQNNLGTACWNLAQHQQPIARLNQAIAAYHAALQYYSPNSEPMHYAMIQNNLGTAYWNLAQHLKPNPNLNLAHSIVSPTRLLQLAIAAYHTALNYRTLDTVPTSFAATQNNLGTAYWNLANLKTTAQNDRKQQLQQAIKAYEAAIAAVEALSAQTEHRPALTFDVFATYNNLGLSYYQLASDRHHSLTPPQRQTLLEASLTQHLQALQGWEPRSDFYQTTLDYITQTTRAFHSEFGIQGQTLALSKIPANLLPEVMRKL